MIKVNNKKTRTTFNNRNTRKECEICSKLIIKTPENVIEVVLVFLLLTLNIFTLFSGVSMVGSEKVNVSWVVLPCCYCFKSFIE